MFATNAVCARTCLCVCVSVSVGVIRPRRHLWYSVIFMSFVKQKRSMSKIILNVPRTQDL